jgi:exoribonuclease-2
MPSSPPVHFNLVAAAHASMIEHGFQPDFPAAANAQLAAIQAHPELPAAPGAQDLRSLLWSSIDNDTSKDLDQIEWAEQLPDGRIRVLVGVADVDARVGLGTVLDSHAKSETTSVYTGVQVFPMLPAVLSEGITSLNENQDRVAPVIEFSVDQAGAVARDPLRPKWRPAPTSPRSSNFRTLPPSAWSVAAFSTARSTLKP